MKRSNDKESFPAGQGRVHFCRGCKKPFKSKNTLSAHEGVCTNLKVASGESYSKIMPLNPPTTVQDSADKVLPLSQPSMETEEEPVTAQVVFPPLKQPARQQTCRHHPKSCPTKDPRMFRSHQMGAYSPLKPRCLKTAAGSLMSKKQWTQS